MANDPMRWLAVALVAAVAWGCGTSARPRFYTLDPTVTAEGPQAAGYGVLVGPVSVPSAVDRPEFVVRVAPNRVEIDEFNRWASPLGESIARAVAGDLAALLGNPHVATAPFANFDPAFRVTLDVHRFDSVRGDSVLVEAVWVVRRTKDGRTRSGRTVARESVQDAGFDALAAAHGRAIARLSADVAAAIRASAGSPR